ncbi:TonB-dependent receptor plug domain-containing protein [Aquabacterium sp.]|uniref:TonB-dependent receptor plug domain-containing protein n=1 Tax=Aquabacterium sp. TaxID=1872578 RepID=UPI0035AD9640
MTFVSLRPSAWAARVLMLAVSAASAQSEPTGMVELETVVVKGARSQPAAPSSTTLNERDLRKQRAQVSDTARLLEDAAGVSVSGAGGISALPAIHGLADDRVRVQVDGMDLMSACPNHMNSPLSYISPADVGKIVVYAGVTPVSVGGDSLGGSIQVESAAPVFADEGEASLSSGHVGAFYRSNAHVHGTDLGATYATQNVSLSYRANESQADNFTAARAFKAAKPGTEGGEPIPGDEVGSSSYRPINQNVALAWRHERHLLQVDVWSQRVTFEGYPNQRMDMTDNANQSVNLRYRGVYDWGTMDARLFKQHTHHEMDMGPDRYQYGDGMPMLTKADTRGGSVKVTRSLGEQDLLRSGAEWQLYRLYDWWPPVGGTMGPNAFWNVDYGRRNRADGFVEWDHSMADQWTTTLGVRHTLVQADAAAVQGYDNSLGMWAQDAANFNARDHQHLDRNWDATALARFEPDSARTWEFGYAHKSRSPNLYQRYPWSTQPMAALMNNFVGDGNGYVGNESLKPEVADTLSVAVEQRDAEQGRWGLKASTYLTVVRDYIDARRCNFGMCSAANVSTSNGYVLLQYANQEARLVGADLSGDTLLARGDTWGSFSGVAKLNWVRGDNTMTGDGLYNTMPLNAKLKLRHRLQRWSQELEWLLVDGKHHVSHVRNEIPTAGYGLLNWRGSYEWDQARVDLGIENLLNRLYYPPLGGAYVGQGASMSTNSIPWGALVPGMGRSLNVAVSLKY